MAKKTLGNYQKVQASTASPGQRVLMVYNGIVKNLNIAINAFNSNEPTKMESINNSIQLAQKIIIELKLALDLENGGEIAENLNSLYDFWYDHLSQANVEKSSEKVKEVLGMVEELRESWAEAEKKLKVSNKKGIYGKWMIFCRSSKNGKLLLSLLEKAISKRDFRLFRISFRDGSRCFKKLKEYMNNGRKEDVMKYKSQIKELTLKWQNCGEMLKTWMAETKQKIDDKEKQKNKDRKLGNAYNRIKKTGRILNLKAN